MTWIKKSEKFLPDISKEKLRQLYRKEKNAKAKLRLLASIQRKEGETLDDISSFLQKPKTTVHDWLKRIESEGLNGFYDIKQKGNRAKLTLEQREELGIILDESPQNQEIPFRLWTTKLVQYIINKNHGISYTQSAIWKLTKKLNFSLKVPRQQHQKANKKAQEEFKKKLKQKFNITLNLDSRSSVLTKHTSSQNHTSQGVGFAKEASQQLNAFIQRKEGRYSAR